MSQEANIEPTARPNYEALDYPALLAIGRPLFPGARIGKPGRSRGYWAMIAAMRLLRVRYNVTVRGADRIADGSAILVANHVSWVDPVAVVMSNWWRVTAFTKVEAFEGRGAVFFRIMGQIPLRRGDEDATHWAMAMSRQVLADGSKIGIYPEGTRSPEPDKLHRLHKRVLVPLLQENPDIPVHAVVTKYQSRPRRRTRVTIDISGPLPISAATMDASELTDAVRDGLILTGGLGYVDVYARDAKRRPAARAADDGAAGGDVSDDDASDDD